MNFSDIISNFKKVRQYDDFTVAYEHMYEPKDGYAPSHNITKNELERCVIRLEVNQDKKGKYGNVVSASIFKCFPSGIDIERDNLFLGSRITPSHLISLDEIELNLGSKKYFLHGVESGLEEIFRRLLKVHLLRVSKIRGILIRASEWMRSTISENFENVANFILKLKEYLDGEKYTGDVDSVYSPDKIKKEHFERNKEAFLKIAPFPECTKFSALILSSGSAIYFVLIFKKFSENKELFAAMYISVLILSYLALSWMIPRFILYSLNVLIHYKYRILRLKYKL